MKMELRLPSFLARVKPKQMTAFTRQLATLINAGLPLLRGLQVLNKQEKNPALKRAIGEMAESIEAGSTFAEALSQHPRIFNKLFVNMVKAGEIGGVLDVVLLRLSEFMEKAQKIKSKIISAMVYPVVVLIMASAILTFLMVFIVPKFQEIFKDLLEGQALPGLTQFVLAVSQTMTLRLPFVIIGIFILVCPGQADRQDKDGPIRDRPHQALHPHLRRADPQDRDRPLHANARHADDLRRAGPAGAEHRPRHRAE